MKFFKNIISEKKSSFFLIIVFFLFFVFATGPVWGGQPDTLFRSDDVVRIELRADFSALQKDREGDPQYRNGELTYLSENGDTVHLDVRLMVRGNFRRDPSICSFPPLWVNFKKKEVENTLFENQDKLKLVTPCGSQEDVIKEYMVYKLYNEVTDLSMKVRLAKILYFDTSENRKLFEKYSFFLEDKDKVAERNGLEAKDRFLTPFDLESESFKTLAVFQYLIGNKDWYVTSRKNLVIMQSDDFSKPPYAVPYDFDLSGLVNADYSKPEGVPEYMLASKRVYKGICYTEDEFNNTFGLYLDLKPRFESIISNQTLLSKNTRKEIIRYIDQFYNVIENQYLFNKEFCSTCQTRQDYNLAELKK
ncbi:MAG: hypothetical protein GX431_11265 [Bacteroidales bacterium]|jgi:hypothetical protein|nr:hypothetical protein [Bacteroidales bacterium]